MTMTNNPTIDGVSRELLANFIEYSAPISSTDQQWHRDKQELRTLLAAPVVERQPVAYISEKGVFVLIGLDAFRAATYIDGHDRAIPDSWLRVYTAPPQLAELQADLASANADKEAYAQNAIDLRKRVDGLRESLTELNGIERKRDAAITERDELQATIERQTALLAEARNALSEIRKACDEGRTYGLIDMLAEDATAALNGDKT